MCIGGPLMATDLHEYVVKCDACGIGWRRHLTVQQLSTRDWLAVEACIVLVTRQQRRSLNTHPRKQPLRARIREGAGEAAVTEGRSDGHVAAEWPSGDGHVAPELELPLAREGGDGHLIKERDDGVCLLPAQLQAEAQSGGAQGRRGTPPAVGQAAHDEPGAERGRPEDARLDVREEDDGASATEHIERDLRVRDGCLVRRERVRQAEQHIGRLLDLRVQGYH
eukprot:CAMPEP_0119361476 /NCGR_PEP_ID=MMETSP1334-20130426/8767_1 /TAXON_ID=127549 /ORGANISM="Calcidiscus leptoporus, Strain RCC1130" /LENGTH=222 /DNA_ID=CAMNT_0007376493 /DNA_START=204 /DNA_END=872 /DNA_ORIENTATION=+